MSKNEAIKFGLVIKEESDRLKRGYEKVIRVNSQSGKGGASFIISEFLGVNMSKNEAIKFGLVIKEESDRLKRELEKEEIIELYKKLNS